MSDALTIDKRQVRRAFDRAAASYDASAGLQQEVGRRLLERTECMKIDPRLVVDAGCGTGFGGRLLLERFAKSRVIGLDVAPSMLHVARGSRPAWKRLLAGLRRDGYVCGDLEALPLADACADMLWSNLAMQWCNDLATMFSGVRRVLRPGGLFIFATFGPDTLKELRQAFSALDGYPHVSHFPDMHDIGDTLLRAGFAAPVMEMEMFTLTYPDLRGVMADLKAIGAHNAAAGRRRGMMGKGEWARLEAAYEQFRREGRLPASYEVIYGHAWSAEGQERAAESPVRFMGRAGRL